MVDITIFLEGGAPPSRDEPALTPDSTILLRESFHLLLTQQIPPDRFNLIIEPKGGYRVIPPIFKKAASKNGNAIVLLDFAEPAEDLHKIRQRTNKYPTDTFDENNPIAFRSACITELGLADYEERVFFMIQEMESWILSQPDKIELFGQKEEFIRKLSGTAIAQHNLLTRALHPEEIRDPKAALQTIFRQFFEQQKIMRDGKVKKKPRQYFEAKDGPKIIALLDLKRLTETFSDAKNLIEWILNDYYVLIIFGTPILTKRRK